MNNKKKIFIITIIILFITLTIQLYFIYYVDYILEKNYNKESKVNYPGVNNLKEINYTDRCNVDFSGKSLENFSLTKNTYNNGNYVKWYRFKGEKNDVLSKIKTLENQGVKIKSLSFSDVDGGDILGEIIIEYTIKNNK